MELIKNKLQYYGLLLDKISNYEESTDAIVPDAFPDIMRIVCANGDAVLKEEAPQNDRILISGTVRTRVLYQPEDDTALKKLEIPISFAHIEECKGIDNESTCFVQCTVSGVEAHAVNSRKVSITARLCFAVSAYQKTETELTANLLSPDMPLEILQENHIFCAPESIVSKEFTILEDPELTDHTGMELVGRSCTIRAEELRAMHGKILLKGTAQLTCMLLQEDAAEPYTETKSIPFTQVMDCPDAEENQTLMARFAVRNLDAELREPPILSVGIHVGVQICTLRQQTVQTIRDVYQTTHALKIDAKQVFLHSMVQPTSLHAETTEEMPIAVPCRKIIAQNAVCYGIQQQPPDTIRILVQTETIYEDDQNSLHQVFRTISVSADDPCPKNQLLSGQFAVQCVAENAAEKTLRIRILADGSLSYTENFAVNHITDIECGEVAAPVCGDATLVIRYVRSSETLWEIAKNYHTTMRAIQQANHLSPETQQVKEQMLLIPICEK